MDANALNAAAWTGFRPRDGGGGAGDDAPFPPRTAERGRVAARRRRAARRLLVVCWIGTALPALELMGWLPWGLANPLAMAAARARLPVALAGVAVAAVAESRRGRGSSREHRDAHGHAHEHAHEHAHYSLGSPTLRWFAGRFGGTVSFLAVGLLVALGPRSLAFPGAVDAFAARWFVHGGLLPALAAGVYFVVGNERDAVFSSRPARGSARRSPPWRLSSRRAFGSRRVRALGTAAPPLSAELFAVARRRERRGDGVGVSGTRALGDGVRRAFQAAPDPPRRGAPTSVAGAASCGTSGFSSSSACLRRGEAATWQSFLLSGGRGRSDASGGSDTYSFDDKRSFAAWGPVLSGSESSAQVRARPTSGRAGCGGAVDVRARGVLVPCPAPRSR